MDWLKHFYCFISFCLYIIVSSRSALPRLHWIYENIYDMFPVIYVKLKRQEAFSHIPTCMFSVSIIFHHSFTLWCSFENGNEGNNFSNQWYSLYIHIYPISKHQTAKQLSRKCFLGRWQGETESARNGNPIHPAVQIQQTLIVSCCLLMTVVVHFSYYIHGLIDQPMMLCEW